MKQLQRKRKRKINEFYSHTSLKNINFIAMQRNTKDRNRKKKLTGC